MTRNRLNRSIPPVALLILALTAICPPPTAAQAADDNGVAPGAANAAAVESGPVAGGVSPFAVVEAVPAKGAVAIMPWDRLLRFAAGAFSGAGAPFMWAILMVSAFATTVGLEKIHFLTVRTGRGGGERFFDEVCRLVRDRRIEEARSLAAGSDTPFGRMVNRILGIRHGHRRDEMQSRLDEAYLKEIPAYHRRLPLLAVCANLATLLGLLGTIAGLIIAFEAVATVAAAQRTAALAGGISVAMATTGFGLLVAIPTLALHGILGARADRAVEEIEAKLASLTSLMEEWNRKLQIDPYEGEERRGRGAEEKIAEFATAGDAQ